MRMLIVNDIHKSARPPVSRTDSYNHCIQRKLKEIADFVNERKIEIVALTGDIFHRKRADNNPYWLAAEVTDWLNSMDCIVVGAIGNHDADLKIGFNRFPLYLVYEAAGVYYRTDSGLVLSSADWHTKTNRKFAIAVINYDIGGSIENLKQMLTSRFSKTRDTLSILIVHGPIIPRHLRSNYPEPFLQYTIDPEELSGLADYVFYGDIHESHGMYKIGETVFCNFGSLARNTQKELNSSRPIAIALFDIETLEISRVELEDVDSPETAFRITEIEEQREHQEELELFIESLGTVEFEILTPDKIRNYIQCSLELPDLHKKLALDILDKIDYG